MSSPIIIPPPVWTWIDNRGTAPIGENVRLEASLDSNAGGYSWSVRVRYTAPERRSVVFRDSEEPVPSRKDAEAAAWDALAKWLGVGA